SSARAALRMLCSPRLPSWQAYSNSPPSSVSRLSGMVNAHGFSHVDGSSKRASHLIALGPTRVNRSVIFSLLLAPIGVGVHEVGGLDHERIALPVPAGVAGVGLHRGRQVSPA